MLGAIWAVNEDGVLGDGKELLWHLPEDLKSFKETTVGSTIIMGRKTWESLPIQPLPGRENIVITTNSNYKTVSPEVIVTTSLDEALDEASNRNRWIIGGSQIYRLALPYCSVIRRTVVRKPLLKQDNFVYEPKFNEFILFEETAWLKSISGLEYKNQTLVKV